MQKPSIPKGTRDFSPVEMAKRNYIFNTIRDVYHLYGYQQIETPAMENLSTLMGKYGEEGDKLLFKILNSGDFLSGVTDDELTERNTARLASILCEKGLRYDLTVPFARYVVQHRNEISFPFKRYQIQPVWRADRPQKGRYREFYQCDGDVVGSDSLMNEVELIQIMDEVFRRFGIRVAIKMNNRKILTGIAEIIGEAEKIVDITVAIDKLDKIGLEKVNEELRLKGLSEQAIEQLQPIILLSGTNQEKVASLKTILAASETGVKGVEELQYILEKIDKTPLQAELELDLTLARGLNYYTGAIFEVKALDIQIGSITGGGRYDNLTGVFGMPGVSGVGISFGADRIFDVLNQLELYPENALLTTQLLFVNFGEKEQDWLLPIIKQVRMAGIRTELYPEAVKMKKQMSYANTKNIPYVAIVGEEELEKQQINFKNMLSGEQHTLSVTELIEYFSGKDFVTGE
ncbi:MAG: histidine--tRNA ligase [Tannerellaceae bacterium]|nr:histidine--tRNA ligase [Tannerellaceae bacterium]